MTTNQNHDASLRNNDRASWSDLNHDLLSIAMMQLGVVDFLAFSGVCKPWRSLVLSKKKKFMASKQHMSISISLDTNKKDYYCYLEDLDGRKFKTTLPHFAGKTCIGSTCGYLIFYGMETKDFCLVNPIKRHELNFPGFHSKFSPCTNAKGVLVFSPSVFGWVFVVTDGWNNIWVSIGGQGVWNHVVSNFFIHNIHAFKGKIYMMVGYNLCELRLNPEPELMLLETKNYPTCSAHQKMLSSGENLYVIDFWSKPYKVHKLNFKQLNWVLCEKGIEEFAFFHGCFKYSAEVKPEVDALLQMQLERFVDIKGKLCTGKMWYYPHECLNVNILDE